MENKINNKEAIVLNIIGGPGVGKSILTSELFAKLKREYGFCDFSLESFGAGGTFARFLKINGKAHIEINVDHLFYQEFLNKCDDTTLGIILRLLVSFNLAKIETTWHNENEKTELFDEFFLKTSELLRTMIKY